MMRMLLLAKSNLRREKGQTAILIVLILIGSMVLNLWLMLATDYRANFDRWHETLHAEDVLLFVPDQGSETNQTIQNVLEDRDDISEYALSEGLTLVVSIPYNDGTVTNPMVVLPRNDAVDRPIGRVEITAQAQDPDGMYFPLVYDTQMLPLGQEVDLEIDGEEEPVKVSGFFNSVMAGSHNCSIVLLLAGDTLYKNLSGQPGTLVSIRLDDPQTSTTVRGELLESLHEVWPDAALQGTDYVRNRQARYVMQMITTSILAAAVCFVLVVAMTVAASNVATHVQQFMPELGVLKSLGYTGTDLIGALVLEYTLLSLPTSVAGAALAYTAFPALSDMMSSQTGLPYEIRFLWGPFAASIAICTGIIALAAWLASKRIRRIEPITALRSGVETHSFKRNPLPLSQSRLDVQAALGMKNCAASPRRNVTIAVTMAALTLLIVFAVTMVANILVDNAPLLNLMGIERADAVFGVSADKEQDLIDALQDNDATERFYLYTQLQDLAEPNGSGLSGIIVDDTADLQNQTILYAGRMPIYDNEVALGAKHAAERNLGVGDTIELGTEEEAVSYLITGLTQGTNYLGDEAFFTRDGYTRMADLEVVSYYVDLTQGGGGTADSQRVDTFLEEVRDAVQGPVTASNMVNALQAVLSVYMNAMEMIVYVLIALTVILTVLVMVLLTRTALQARFRDFGILKAVGYTTRNLIGQTVLSFSVPLALSEIAGLIVWSLTGNSIVSLFMRSLGTMRCDFVIPVVLIVFVGLALLAFALLVVALMASRIRRVNPVMLMADD